jgi:hypothetical protein
VNSKERSAGRTAAKIAVVGTSAVGIAASPEAIAASTKAFAEQPLMVANAPWFGSRLIVAIQLFSLCPLVFIKNTLFLCFGSRLIVAIRIFTYCLLVWIVINRDLIICIQPPVFCF